MKLPRPLRAPASITRRPVSAFAGCYVHEAIGMALLPGSVRSRFEDDLWDMRGLADKPRSIKRHELTWNFFKIVDPKWRVVAKEILIALLAPQHDSVLECALALRKNRSPRTCNRFLRRFTAWFNWLTANGITSLDEVTQEHCDRFAAEEQWYVPKPDAAPVQAEPETLAESVRVVQLITLYGDLLSTDSYLAGFVPWDGQSTIKVVGGTWLRANRTPSVPDHLLQPVLATCLYLVNTVGPHLADLVERVRKDAATTKDLPRATLTHVPDLKHLIAQMHADRVPLPQADGRADILRISTGDLAPLKDLAWYRLAHQVGTSTIAGDYLREKIAPELLALAEDVGFENYWARTAPTIAREEDGALVPWTAPLSDAGVASMVANVLSACLVVTSALSVGCRRQTQTKSGGTRYRLAGRLIKGQKLGGVPDEWVVIEDVHRAVALAERRLGAPPGTALFNTVTLSFSLTRMRKWLEESGNRERRGLPIIPAGPISAQMLRRTLALSIAARPGGSQRLFLTEVEEAEQEKHMELTVEAFRDLKEGRKPTGPGARGLIEALQHVDAQLNEAAHHDPKVLEDDRHLENLLSKLSKVLHVGAANFCWFRDPSKALCLKLAGTPNAKKPLVGMCDSARCPQATHHRSHRPVWLGQVTLIDTFVESPRVAKGEKKRLQPERDRALRVVAEIDAASPAA